MAADAGEHAEQLPETVVRAGEAQFLGTEFPAGSAQIGDDCGLAHRDPQFVPRRAVRYREAGDALRRHDIHVARDRVFDVGEVEREAGFREATNVGQAEDRRTLRAPRLAAWRPRGNENHRRRRILDVTPPGPERMGILPRRAADKEKIPEAASQVAPAE